MRKQESIVYVNFAQYDNTGRILDYLLENFNIVAHYSFDHLRLQSGRKHNYLTVYQNGKVINKRKLFSFRPSSVFLYPSLPIVAFLIFFQTIFYTIFLSFRHGKFDTFLSVNAFSILVGIFLRSLGCTKKVTFWVWDYFPVKYPDLRLKFARWIYWQMDKPCMLLSDKLVFTNKKLLYLRKKSNHLRKGKKASIVPIGSKVQGSKNFKNKKTVIGFLGMLKYPQGLDLPIDCFDKILKMYPNIKFEIVGSGPDETAYRKKTKRYGNSVKFYGFIDNQDQINKIVGRWTMGLATYVPIPYNESYWGDPSKIKTYLSVGTPVITTNVSYMAEEIKKYSAGKVIDYSPREFLKGVGNIIKNRDKFSKNAIRLAKKYDYRKLYPLLFS